jgi:NAD-dependent dihydropyrimidine dehydrogenase PreA subunit
VVRRKIIKIDESLCTGCGDCIISCAEGAIELVDGKARVISDKLCDGLGACIGKCPVGALAIEERETEDFDERLVNAHLEQPSITRRPVDGQEQFTIAPCNASFEGRQDVQPKRHMHKIGPSSQLCSWPIQMSLAHVDAPYFDNAQLLIAADCSGFASASIAEFIKDRVVLIGCPKLDDVKGFVEKLIEILRANDIKGITVLHMEVPCCNNLMNLISAAVERSGKKVLLEQHICGIEGAVVKAGCKQ